MRTLLLAIVLTGMACGGGPVLQNAPRPDPSVVAGVAAAAAAAVTLADPDAAARKGERKGGEPERRPVGGRTTVPADVLDRLDHPAVDGGVDAAPPAEVDAAPRP